MTPSRQGFKPKESISTTTTTRSYNPTAVPQVSPFSTGTGAQGAFGVGASAHSLSTSSLHQTNAPHSTGNIHHSQSATNVHSKSYSGAANATRLSGSKANMHSTASTGYYNGSSTHNGTNGKVSFGKVGSRSSSTSKLRSSKSNNTINHFAAGSGSGALALHHQHTQHRGSLKEIWFRLRDDEREQIGQFEAWAEIQGMCRDCFTPGSSPIDAPRTHHRGMTWSDKHGWRVTKAVKTTKTTRISKTTFLGKVHGSSSSSSSSTSSSSSSSSDSSSYDERWTSSQKAKKKVEHQIRREKKVTSRHDRLSKKQFSTSSSSHKIRDAGLMTGAAIAVGKVFGGDKKSSTSTTKKTTSTTSSKSGLRGGQATNSVFYDPGYTPDGKANPRYYEEGKSQIGRAHV